MNARASRSNKRSLARAPDCSHPTHGFHRFDGTQADWRTSHPDARLSAHHRFLQRWRIRLANLVSVDPHERHDIGVFIVGVSWGVMCAIGMMAAWGIHP